LPDGAPNNDLEGSPSLDLSTGGFPKRLLDGAPNNGLEVSPSFD